MQRLTRIIHEPQRASVRSWWNWGEPDASACRLVCAVFFLGGRQPHPVSLLHLATLLVRLMNNPVSVHRSGPGTFFGGSTSPSPYGAGRKHVPDPLATGDNSNVCDNRVRARDSANIWRLFAHFGSSHCSVCFGIAERLASRVRPKIHCSSIGDRATIDDGCTSVFFTQRRRGAENLPRVSSRLGAFA